MRYLTSAVALAVATMLGVAQPAAASGFWFSWVATVHVSIPDVESQAQLAAELSAEGYDNVILSASYPTIGNPHPELNDGLINSRWTPVHAGWNGVAYKKGQISQVYATSS
ncbi:MAG: hypothetical protein P4L52_07945 [Acidocella sp.]|nr:hypothetical protein [Acidocella sp.]